MEDISFEKFSSAEKAVDQLEHLYHAAISELRIAISDFLSGKNQQKRVSAHYPLIRISVEKYEINEPRQSSGYLSGPGIYETTITRPDLFRDYLIAQIDEVMQAHACEVEIGYSDTPIPIHFALDDGAYVTQDASAKSKDLRDYFDVPSLEATNDDIVDGIKPPQAAAPLAPFTAQRVDYSLARLAHYTATMPKYFQNFVLFTNYQFYVEEFEKYARKVLNEGSGSYESFVGPGNHILQDGKAALPPPERMPQMPSYHLTRADGNGISLVNIGVGPSNAKTATDHIAVLRPHAWVMLGHCAGLRNSQTLGDFVLAHAYMREDHVLDEDLPSWVPIPPLAEIQIAIQEAVAKVTRLEGYELKRIMRTGTVATIDNRNWELRDQSGPVRRLSQSRAIALDMESATIAANGYRFRVPYGTFLCVSDKPLHGELKLPGMATGFYKTQISRHLRIGIEAMEMLRERPLEELHSRKLRSFDETAFR